MAKLPPRRLLRSVLNDAINDREQFLDANRPTYHESNRETKIVTQTRELITRYKELEARLDSPKQLTSSDHETLSIAVHHARIWRVSLLDCWKGTGDKAVIRECREDIARLEKVEAALGVTPHFTVGGPEPEGCTMVSITDLHRAANAREPKHMDNKTSGSDSE